MKYIIGIDQSTQGTKAMLFDEVGKMLKRCDLPHEQIISETGWVSHNPEEIYKNTVSVVKNLIEETGVDKADLMAVGISNQRETSVCWERSTGKPVDNAIVWQCSRAEYIAKRVEDAGAAEEIRRKTGINLSPFFPASKYAWLLENNDGVKERAKAGEICLGTIDSYLVFRLTGGKSFKTDYSNASRTQLFNISTLKWDEDILKMFDIPLCALPEVTPSDADFGETDFEGYLDKKIPVHGVLGDSHAALYGQGCLVPGTIKATYGTGSSVMMNVGDKPVFSDKGIVSSLAWHMHGKAQYVLEGNIIYTGAVMSWMVNDLKLFPKATDSIKMMEEANPDDKTYLVPAFTGLGAPYWESNATAMISGMTRTTGKNEIVKAGVECTAYQICDIITAMREDAGIKMADLRVDGGPTKNYNLMQFQADIINSDVLLPDAEELSGIGAAYCAGVAIGIYDESRIFENFKRKSYSPKMDESVRKEKLAGWKKAVGLVLKGAED
ncbi:MAG: glycerol kinase GlpK [Lachnospiraceae bacterium]|nr:glycerol kinase GlpK [Lachnospiraceae bacterium]